MLSLKSILNKYFHSFKFFLSGKEDEEKKKAKENSDKLEEISKMDQNQNGIANGKQGDRIMIE